MKSGEKMNNRLLVLLNLVVLAGTIYWNYYSNTGAINGNTMGSLSDTYANLFTPSGYAFSIWGLIYVGLIGNAIFLLKHYDSKLSATQGALLSITNLLNCLWIYVWLMEYTGLSVLVMILILTTLTTLINKIQIGKEKRSVWIWWPISIYFGWIIVALVANASAYLAKINWNILFNEPIWAILMMTIATGIYLILLIKRNLSYAAYVGVWALAAIAFKQWEIEEAVAYVAAAAGAAIFITTILKDYQFRKKGLY